MIIAEISVLCVEIIHLLGVWAQKKENLLISARVITHKARLSYHDTDEGMYTLHVLFIVSGGV